MDKTNDNAERFQITELFMVKADSHRKFIGEINRHSDVDGNKFVTGKAFVQDGNIWSIARDQFELSINLDEICKLKLDNSLHNKTGVIFTIMDERFFLN